MPQLILIFVFPQDYEMLKLMLLLICMHVYMHAILNQKSYFRALKID